MSRHRAYVFTINNPSVEDCKGVEDISDISQYIVAGNEKGDEGTAHLQGYIYFKEAKTFTSVKKKLPRAHIEAAVASPDKNREYCTKQGKIFIEKGILPKQGCRTDIDNVRVKLKEGCNMRAIIDTAKSYQSIKIAEVWLKYNEPYKSWKPEIRWYHGASESGKTKAAIEWLGDDYYTPVSFKWWEGYDANENVLLDEIRKDFCKYHELLKLLDRYQYKVECKGGSRQLLAKKIAITSPFSPERMYGTREDLYQLIRRIDKVVQCGHVVVDVNEYEEEDDPLL